ncbi:hypothetical protein E2C01_079401 [Portunus trituberculatus]|uniref:Uncharacterized protein n=1 Tax=Portunus trituberculatus TaxID=210409 RepID=A0A5B7ISN8_PORTR|nr:hypothetical protein [Portunus trituberculatus]
MHFHVTPTIKHSHNTLRGLVPLPPAESRTSHGRDARKSGFARVPKKPGARPFPVIIQGRGAIRGG